MLWLFSFCAVTQAEWEGGRNRFWHIKEKGYRTFTELKLKKLDSNQLEIIERAESFVDHWKNFEALLYDAEFDNNNNPKEFASEARNKRATDQTCCKQVFMNISESTAPLHLFSGGNLDKYI